MLQVRNAQTAAASASAAAPGPGIAELGVQLGNLEMLLGQREEELAALRGALAARDSELEALRGPGEFAGGRRWVLLLLSPAL